MRIAFFSTMGGMPWGGSEELWSRSAAVLLERGHEVFFNCLRRRGHIAPPLQQLMQHGAQGKFRPKLRIGRSLRQTLQKLHLTGLKHRSWLQKTRPDFVVISFASHTDDPAIANTCRALGVPYSIVLQAAGPHIWMDPRALDDYRSAY